MAEDSNNDHDSADDREDPAPNPFEAMFRAMGIDPSALGGRAGAPDMGQFMQQLQQAFGQFGMPSPGAGGIGFQPPGGAGTSKAGVNWDQIRDVARKSVAALGPDPSPLDSDRRELREAVELAESWLDGATSLPRVSGTPAVWSRAEWVENTLPLWRRLAEPVAESMADALADSLAGGQAADPAMAGMSEFLKPMLRNSGGALFAMQMGQGLGKLATQVVGVTDIGLPLTSQQQVVLLPANVKAFGEGLEQSATDVRIYLTLREAARQRLFAATPWLRDQVHSLVLQYARGITIDTSALEGVFGDLEASFDPGKLEELSAELEGRLLQPATSDEQRETLESVETLLALVEGWVDEVVGRATASWMPAAAALTEVLRRNNATAGPAEQTFASLIGLELRPARKRAAATLWAALRDARGADGRDEVWAHPDMMPTAAALDDPIGYVRGEQGISDLDAELAKLLDQEGGDKGSGPA